MGHHRAPSITKLIRKGFPRANTSRCDKIGQFIKTDISWETRDVQVGRVGVFECFVLNLIILLRDDYQSGTRVRDTITYFAILAIDVPGFEMGYEMLSLFRFFEPMKS